MKVVRSVPVYPRPYRLHHRAPPSLQQARESAVLQQLAVRLSPACSCGACCRCGPRCRGRGAREDRRAVRVGRRGPRGFFWGCVNGVMARFSERMVTEVVQKFWAAMARGEFLTDAAAEAGTCRVMGARWLRAEGGVRPRSGRDLKGRCLTFAEREARRISPSTLPSRSLRQDLRSAADGPGRGRRISRCPRRRPSTSKLLRAGSHNARNRSTVEFELALRPAFRLPKPGCHRRRDLRNEARGAGHRF
jgi:hypothetical protein